MRAAGFKDVHLGRGVDVDGKPAPAPEDIAAAAALNLNWFRHRRGLPPLQTSHSSYPPGSIGDGYERALKLRADARHERPRASPGPESSIVATTGRAPGSTLSRSSGTAIPRP